MANKSKIVLASASTVRKTMLENAGVVFEVSPADIEEQTMINTYLREGHSIAAVTEKLAQEKAKTVSNHHPSAYVIGSDQTLEFGGTIFSKAKTKEEAKEKLKLMRGKTHTLRSSACVVKDGLILFSHTDQVELMMHNITDDELETYMEKDPESLTSCVGGYKIEGLGSWLFMAIKGDYFTIMGMPLLSLLAFLRLECGAGLR